MLEVLLTFKGNKIIISSKDFLSDAKFRQPSNDEYECMPDQKYSFVNIEENVNRYYNWLS